MIRLAQSGDEGAIDAFLKPHSESSMFLRSNLAQFGVGPNRSDDPRATTFWLIEDGPIRAVFGRSNGGFLMGQSPDNDPADWQAFRDVLHGATVAGITGATPQIKVALDVLDLRDAPFSMMRDEPHYKLDLRDLEPPLVDARLRPAQPGDFDTLFDWVMDYDTSVLGSSATEETRIRARTNAHAHMNSDNHRILEVGGTPVAKTAFNAALPDMVQIGGVYTPPEHRSKGYARTAVALHLLEARKRGVKIAILFASGEPACRAYEAIGFQRIGTYTLAILAEPCVIGSDG
ncbi:GNAT family N-acetyltransferase [Aliiroseovarius sp. Z3]|nr:GNAT family N-acetyltransferase [Aliiroseovarius sp. Z3]